MELFILPCSSVTIAKQLSDQLQQIQHLTTQQITPTLLSCATDDLFPIVHEIDCATLFDTLFYDFEYNEPYLYGSCPNTSPIINHLLSDPQLWQNIKFPQHHEIEQLLPTLAQNNTLITLTKMLLDTHATTTLNAYFKNNLNVVQTAKSLYIHRNTLNYRLDQIFTSTGINPRSFYGAMYFHHIIHATPSE